MTEGPLLWLVNRSTGISLLVVLSLSVALGVLALGGRVAGDGGGRVPRFVTRALHRNLALGAVVLLVAHAVTAVADEYVDVRWWHAFVPWGAAYEPLWLGLGTLSLDLLLAVVVTTALRGRLGHRAWRSVHLTTWLAWLAGVVHGVLIGTDLRSAGERTWWAVVPTAVSVGIVLVAVGLRFRPEPRGPEPRSTAPRRPAPRRGRPVGVDR